MHSVPADSSRGSIIGLAEDEVNIIPTSHQIFKASHLHSYAFGINIFIQIRIFILEHHYVLRVM